MNKKKFIIILSSLLICLVIVIGLFFVVKPYLNNNQNTKSKELLKYEEQFKLSFDDKKKEWTVKAFKGNKKAKVVIPETIDGYPVTRLEDNSYDFASFSKVQEIVISKNINYIGSKSSSAIFLCADGLSTITVVEENVYFESFDGVLYTEDLSTLLKFPNSKGYNPNLSIIEIEISDNVKTIGKYAFANNQYIQSVIIGENVVEIKDYAFKNCPNLHDITFNQKLEKIGNYAFRDCDLPSAELPASLKSIGNGCFYNNPTFGTIVLNSVVSLGNNCFSLTITRNNGPVIPNNNGQLVGLTYTFNIIAPEEMEEYFSNKDEIEKLGLVRVTSYNTTIEQPGIGDQPGIKIEVVSYPSGTIMFNNKQLKYE